MLTPFFFAELLAEAVLLPEVPFASVTSGLVSKNNANATVESVGNTLRGERLASLRADVALACVMGGFQCGSGGGFSASVLDCMVLGKVKFLPRL